MRKGSGKGSRSIVNAALPASAGRLAQAIAKLPGVGEKTAARYALFLLTTDEETARSMGRELTSCRDRLRPCSSCGHIAELPDGLDLDLADDAEIEVSAICSICADPKRSTGMLCVVETVQDLLAIERSGEMKGRYFVLGQIVRVQDGVDGSDLPCNKLRSVILDETNPIKEVLLAISPSMDGQTTAMILMKELESTGVKVTRIASGIPNGGHIEHTDMVTVGLAIVNRKVVEDES